MNLTDDEAENTGAGLAERARANKEANDYVKSMSTPPKEEPAASPYAATPQDRVAHPRPVPKGEKDMKKKAEDWAKPLGSYKHGTDYVPQTGVYKLHEGEAVTPKEKNPAAKGSDMEHSSEEKAHFSRAMHKLHGGALHRHFGIPEDQPIPEAKKEEAAHSENPHVAAMGRMAKAMAGWKHGKK